MKFEIIPVVLVWLDPDRGIQALRGALGQVKVYTVREIPQESVVPAFATWSQAVHHMRTNLGSAGVCQVPLDVAQHWIQNKAHSQTLTKS